MIPLLSQMSPATMGTLVLVTIVLLGAFVLFVRWRSGHDDEADTPEATVDDYVAANGEPEDAIIMDVTRSNELAAVVLVYDNDIIVNGNPIARDKITNVTFYNASNPYVNSEYLLVITTSLPECPSVETTIGTDARQASDVVTRLAGHLNLPS